MSFQNFPNCPRRPRSTWPHVITYTNCPLCSKQIQDPGKPQRYVCCDSMKLIRDRHLMCINCGQVHDEYFAPEYVDFYENRHKIRKKSVYHRKYHIINVMNDIDQKITSKWDIITDSYRQTYSFLFYVYNL